MLVGGLDWAYELSRVGNGYALRGTNIAYDTHWYTRWYATGQDWRRAFGFLTSRFPITATGVRLGRLFDRRDSSLLDYLDAPQGVRANRMAWMIWSWNDPGTAASPASLRTGQNAASRAARAQLGPAPGGLRRRGPAARTPWRGHRGLAARRRGNHCSGTPVGVAAMRTGPSARHSEEGLDHPTQTGPDRR